MNKNEYALKFELKPHGETGDRQQIFFAEGCGFWPENWFWRRQNPPTKTKNPDTMAGAFGWS